MKETNLKTSVAVIGGGLAGVYAARLLVGIDIDFQLFEARKRLGGRILTTDETNKPSDDGFDLGPSWYWPGMQPEMAALVEELGLAAFPQTDEGDVVFERMSREGPRRYSGMPQEPQSMRLVGGTGSLIKALSEKLPPARLHLETRLTHVILRDSDVLLKMVGAGGSEREVKADRVIFAVPPRLLEETVSFSPELEPETKNLWRQTATWMAPHAKFFAVYERAFWRDLGLSGTAQSMVGPLVEIHDATTRSGARALFGFLGVPADQRAKIGEESLTEACIKQLVRLFGPEAARPRATLFKDWAADSYTATIDDLSGGAHPEAAQKLWAHGIWQDRIHLAGSETSPIEPGYLAGAVHAAKRTVNIIKGKSSADGERR